MARFSTVVGFDARVDLAPLSPLVRRLLVLVVPAWPCLVVIGSFVLWLVLLGRKCEFPRNLRTGPISPRG